MNLEELTPAERMDEDAYKDLIINKYGHIQNLAKIMMHIRNSINRGQGEARDDAVKKRAPKEDMALYCQIIKDIDASRKILNKIHMRLCYLQKEKSLTEVSFQDIREAVKKTSEYLYAVETLCNAPLSACEIYTSAPDDSE